MSANPKPSKFQGLFNQASQSPLPANEPVSRNEHEEPADLSTAPQSVGLESTASPEPIPEPVRPAQAKTGQGTTSAAEKRQPGRPPGKRTDKDWKQFSILLRHEDQFQAVNILRSTRDKRDFSLLMQGLLEGWIKKQTHGR